MDIETDVLRRELEKPLPSKRPGSPANDRNGLRASEPAPSKPGEQDNLPRDVGREPRVLVEHVCLVDVALEQGTAAQVVHVNERTMESRAGPQPLPAAADWKVTPLRWGMYEDIFVLTQHKTSGEVQIRMVDPSVGMTEWEVLHTE